MREAISIINEHNTADLDPHILQACEMGDETEIGPSRQINVAFAAFDDLRWLRAAVINLLQLGCPSDDIVVLGDETAYDGALLNESIPSIRTAFLNLIDWMTKPEQTSDLETVARVSTSDLPSFVKAFNTWLLPDQANHLAARLKDGDAALFVAADDYAELADCCRVLLRYATDSVQSHQVSWD